MLLPIDKQIPYLNTYQAVHICTSPSTPTPIPTPAGIYSMHVYTLAYWDVCVTHGSMPMYNVCIMCLAPWIRKRIQ